MFEETKNGQKSYHHRFLDSFVLLDSAQVTSKKDVGRGVPTRVEIRLD